MTVRSNSAMRSIAGAALAGLMLTAAGCQSGDGGMLGMGKAKSDPATVADGRTTVSELTGYCPRITLREGTAYYNTYAKGGDGDKSKIIYQASIADVTRSCSRSGGQLTMNVAVAGRIVSGPAGSAGQVNLPIRVVIMEGETVAYSKLFQHPVSVGSAATQFIFNDPNATVPDPTDNNIRVFAGFDEGPPKAKKGDAPDEIVEAPEL